MQLKEIQARLAERICSYGPGMVSLWNGDWLASRAYLSLISEVLKGKKCLSMQTPDIIMRELGLNVFDLIREGEKVERDVN